MAVEKPINVMAGLCSYDQLTVFGNGTLTLPDDLTIPVGATLFVDGVLNGTPAGSGTVKFAVKLNANGGTIAVPAITSPAEDKTVTVYEGEQATMTIEAEHAAAYQGSMGTDGGASWTECGTGSPTYTTGPTKLENNGYLYMCVMTGLNELDKEELPPKEEQPPEEELPPKEEIPPEGAVMSLRSRSRSTDDGLPDNAPATESPIFTLEVSARTRSRRPATPAARRPGSRCWARAARGFGA